MNTLKISHSVSLPIPEDSLTPERHRRYRKTGVSLRDESPRTELPHLPQWMLNTPINSKFPMIPAPKGKIVLFTTNLCQTLHPNPSGLDFDPSAQGVSAKYKSLHDPHLKRHYWQQDSFERLVRGGFVTADGKVKCTLQEFNEFQQHLKRVRLEKLDQDRKGLLQLERDEKEQKRYDMIKTADQLAREKRLQDTQKRWKKINKEKQKRLKQQLDAYNAKHASIVTEQWLRNEIDEVRQELEEQRRLNHKLQMEKEEREKKITFLQKRAREERRRAKMLEEREITAKEDRQKMLKEKWERKQSFNDSRIAREHALKQRYDSNVKGNIISRTRKTELCWIKQQADLARITEARMKKAAEEEVKITANLEKKLAIVRKRFQRKLKKLQAMLRSGGIPPVAQLKRTQRFAIRKIQWEIKREMEIQLKRERELKREIERKLRIERQREFEQEKARAASIPITSYIESFDTLPDVNVSGHLSWGEIMRNTGLSPEILPPITPTRKEPDDQDEEEKEEHKDHDEEKKEKQTHRDNEEQRLAKTVDLARALVTSTVEKAMAKNVVDVAVKKAVVSDLVTTAMKKAYAITSQPIISAVPEPLQTPSTGTEIGVEEIMPPAQIQIEDEHAQEAAEEISTTASIVYTESEKQPDIFKVQETPSKLAARALANEAISSAYAELDHNVSETRIQKAMSVKPWIVHCRKTLSDLGRTLASEAVEDSVAEIVTDGICPVESILRQTPSNTGRILAQDAVDNAVYEITQDENNLRQTPSNIGKFLAKDALLSAVDDLERTTEAKLCLTFRDEICKGDFEILKEVIDEGSAVVERDLAGDELTKLQDMADNYSAIDYAVCRETSSDIARDLAASAIADAARDLEDAEGIKIETTLRPTSSNIARKLVKGAIARSKDDINETMKIDRARKRSSVTLRGPSKQLKGTPSNIARYLAKGAIKSAICDTEFDESVSLEVGRKTPSNMARILAERTIGEVAKDLETDPVMHIIYRKTPSNFARVLANDAIQIAVDDLKTTLRKSPSNMARDLTKGALVDAVEELNDQSLQYTLPMPVRKSPSDLGRGIAECILAEASNELLQREGKPLDRLFLYPSLRKTPSNMARGLAKGALLDAVQELNDQSSQYTLPVSVRKSPSDIGRGIAETIVDEATTELQQEEKTQDRSFLYSSLRKTPSNMARGLAKGALLDAVQELNDQSSQYTLPVSVRKSPSDMGRGIAESIVDEAINELKWEGKSVDRSPLHSTVSNVARSLAKTAINDTKNEFKKQTSKYLLPNACRKTPSDIARVVAGDAVETALSELEDRENTVTGIARLTPSKLARDIAGSVISEAQEEMEESTRMSSACIYPLSKKTSSNIARDITVGALMDGVSEIEHEGQAVEGILRKTPSNVGRILAQDVIGETLEELEEAACSPQPIPARSTLPRTSTPSNVLQEPAAELIYSATSNLEKRSFGDEISSSETTADLDFNDDDIMEMWGNTSAIVASVIDVFNPSVTAKASYDVESEDEEDDEEEVIGILENPMIAEETRSATLIELAKSSTALTEIIYVSDKDEVVVEGVVRIASDEVPSAADSVTETVLSLQSLTKNASGQLVRHSSYSSTEDEDTYYSVDEDTRKGPQYFKVVPLYNDKLIDVEDEVIKSNLSVISIKPDPKMTIAEAHQPQGRNSFRNIFRPDMTHCEGSARCLKNTLVSQLAHQESTDSHRKYALDEYCKVLDEEHPDITARHSDEELVTVGDVEGVCMRPKRRAYQTHFITTKIPEKPKEDSSESDTSSANVAESDKKSGVITSFDVSDGSSDKNVKSTKSDCYQANASPMLQQTKTVVKNKTRESITDTQEDVSNLQRVLSSDEHKSKQPKTMSDDFEAKNFNESHSNTQTVAKHSILNAIVSKLSLLFSRQLNNSKTCPSQQEQHKPVSHGYEKDRSNSLSELTDPSCSRETSNEVTTDKKIDCQVSTLIIPAGSNATKYNQAISIETDPECVTSKSAVTERSLFSEGKIPISVISHENKTSNSFHGLTEEPGTTLSDSNKIFVTTASSTVNVGPSTEKQRRSSKQCNNIIENASDQDVVNQNLEKSLNNEIKNGQENINLLKKEVSTVSLNGFSNGFGRKTSGHSVIYVKPAETKHSRSSCTVLVAGKSISLTSQTDGLNDRFITSKDNESHSIILHQIEPKTAANRSIPDVLETDNHHLSVAQTGSEGAGFQKHRVSQTALRKLSQQVIPTSSHRLLEMTCKLSHSAGELVGMASQLPGNSELDGQINKETLWPISRLTSECGSDWSDEGLRTRKGTAETRRQTGSDARPSIVPTTEADEFTTIVSPSSNELPTEAIIDLTSGEFRSPEEQVNNHNSTDSNEQQSCTSRQPTDSRLLGRLSAIISRVFLFKRSSRVIPLSDDDFYGSTEK